MSDFKRQRRKSWYGLNLALYLDGADEAKLAKHMFNSSIDSIEARLVRLRADCMGDAWMRLVEQILDWVLRTYHLPVRCIGDTCIMQDSLDGCPNRWKAQFQG